MAVEFMLDSCNLKEIKKVKSLGLLGGLTTNPLILKRGLNEMEYEGNFYDLARKILKLTGNKPVFFQTASRKRDEMIAQAIRIYSGLKDYGNVHIKVPIDTREKEDDENYDGYLAIGDLVSKGIPVLATAIVTPPQAFLAAKAGANYVVLMLRPYDDFVAEALNVKLDKEGFIDSNMAKKAFEAKNQTWNTYLSGFDTLRRTANIFKNQNLETKLIIAGIRNPLQLSTVLETEGVDALTLPYSVFKALFSHNRTQKFVNDTIEAAPKSYMRFLENGR